MKRTGMLLSFVTALVGLFAVAQNITSAAEAKKKVLFFTRSAGYEHPPVTRHGDELGAGEKYLVQWGEENGFDVVCTKDGAVFDGDLDQYDAFIFYTSGDLTGKCDNPQPDGPMSPEGKKRFLKAIDDGKGFVGIHASTDTFRSDGIDPYVAMLGGEFFTHGEQQVAAMKIVDPKFPGMSGLGDGFSVHDEWYSQHKFPKDLHVILVQETAGMQGPVYQRPPYPATWARMQGKGRVFYTSMGHDAIWANPTFRQVLLGGIDWALGNVDADVTPNMEQVTPRANELKN